jgi:hypothetical protein
MRLRPTTKRPRPTQMRLRPTKKRLRPTRGRKRNGRSSSRHKRWKASSRCRSKRCESGFARAPEARCWRSRGDTAQRRNGSRGSVPLAASGGGEHPSSTTATGSPTELLMYGRTPPLTASYQTRRS